MFTSKLNFSFLPNFPLGPWPFFSQVLLHVSQTANGIFMPSSLSLGFNGNKKHFLLLVILNNATTFAASKHERAIYFLLIPCPLKMTSCYFFWNISKRWQGQHSHTVFPKANGEVPPLTLEFGGTVPPHVPLPSWAAAVKASYDTLLEPLFCISQQPLVGWVPVLPILPPSPTKTQMDKIFCLPVHRLVPLWLTLSSSICIHRRCHGITRLEFMCKANQVDGHRRATTITSVFPSPPGAWFFWARLTCVPGCRRKAGWQCCSFTWTSTS